jgi:hypothetical protein
MSAARHRAANKAFAPTPLFQGLICGHLARGIARIKIRAHPQYQDYNGEIDVHDNVALKAAAGYVLKD